jgi:hypothetical protein
MLRALPAGDLDADGRADLIAAGRDKLYVFYGGSERLKGWAVAESADAQLEPLIDHSRPFDTGFASGLLLAIGDLDGDGASDLATYVPPALQISYGSKKRWAGPAALTPDYSLELPPSVDETRLVGAAAGDIDSDGFADIVVMTEAYPDGGMMFPKPKDTMYRIYGDGTRLTGARSLGPSDVYTFGPVDVHSGPNISGALFGSPFADTPFASSVVSLAGDVDGDGSCEILAGHTDSVTTQGDSTGVYLIPSSPRIPD